MNHAKIRVREEELLKLVLDFLTSRNLNVSMRTLEKESGVVNSPYTEDILFLRELILDGDWDEVLLFAQPFEGLVEFDSKQFKYLILKQKFLELLSLKSHVVGKKAANSIEDVMKTLNLLEENCPSKEEYSNLCWLLTVPNLSERNEFKDWTLDNSRLKCFTAVLDVICKVPTLHKKSRQCKSIASKDRLLQLVVKGLFYETCIEHCQSKATGTKAADMSTFSVRTNILQGIADDYSANLLSWVRSLGDEVFNQPFEQVSVEIVLEKLAKFDKNLRHSVDIPKKGKKEKDNDNIIFRSLSSLDPAIINKRRPTINTNKESSLVKDKSALDDLDFIPANEIIDNGLANDNAKCLPKKDTAQVRKEKQDEEQKEKHYVKKESFEDKDKYHHERASNSNVYDNLLQNVDLKDGKRQDSKNVDAADPDSFEPKVNLSFEDKIPTVSNTDSVPVKSPSPKQSMNEDLYEIEEKKRRESVMKKLEEYENRKKMMQLQLEQISQGLGKSDTESKSKDTNGIEANQVNDVSSHRQYVTAKDLVTDYDTSDKHQHTVPALKVDLQDKAELKDKANDADYKPMLKEAMLKEGEKKQIDIKTPEHGSAKAEDDVSSKIKAKASTTPKNSGFFVNLSDGSGKISTSTPKAKKQSVTETPPPEASPVKPVDWGKTTPKTTSKKALQKQIISNNFGKEKISNKLGKKEEKIEMKKDEQDERISDQKGKENASKDVGYSRKGPVINGVRRTLVSPNQHLIQPSRDSGANKPENAKPFKLNAEEDANKQPLEPMNAEVKPLSKNVENVQNIKGPGPKIKLRDGSKVAVTELLKSREEIKNAMASKQRYESPEPEEKVVVQNNIKDVELKESESKLNFMPVCLLEDSQAIRAVCFHPDGKLFAVGSNSKILRVCTVKNYKPVSSHEGEAIPPPSIVFKRNKYHKGSIYCMTWNPLGDIIATGSNDKSIKLLHFDPDNFVQEGAETELNIHNGTVRELSFVPDKPAILISGGAGDGGVQVTDCSTCQTIGTLRGHTGNVMAVYAGEGDIVATGSTDNTLRLWDLRSHRCIDVVLVGDSSPASVALSHNGSYLASGQEDGCILLYDISAGRTLQSFRLHQEDCRSVRFSPDSKYLLTGSYDSDVSLLHTEGDLELIVPQHYKVAGHKDKVIQCRWHPNRYTFLSSSADRTAVVWSSDVDRNLLFS